MQLYSLKCIHLSSLTVHDLHVWCIDIELPTSIYYNALLALNGESMAGQARHLRVDANAIYTLTCGGCV